MKKLMFLILSILFLSSISSAQMVYRAEKDPKVGTLTTGKWCSESDGKVTCTQNTPLTSITGSDTQVLFFDGSNNPAGAAGFTYDKTTGTLSAGAANFGTAGASGSIDLLESGTSPTYKTTVQSGDLSGNITLTLPESTGTILSNLAASIQKANINWDDINDNLSGGIETSVINWLDKTGIDASGINWDEFPNTPGYLTDAPSDGTLYGRQDGGWVEASTSSSSGACWDINGSGDLQPVSGECIDTLWELDANSDLEPQI